MLFCIFVSGPSSDVPGTSVATKSAKSALAKRVLLGKRRGGQTGNFTFEEGDTDLLLHATLRYRATLVDRYIETAEMPRINCRDVLESLCECGGEYAKLAQRFTTEKNGHRRLADRLRYAVEKELIGMGVKEPKSKRRKKRAAAVAASAALVAATSDSYDSSSP